MKKIISFGILLLFPYHHHAMNQEAKIHAFTFVMNKKISGSLLEGDAVKDLYKHVFNGPDKQYKIFIETKDSNVISQILDTTTNSIVGTLPGNFKQRWSSLDNKNKRFFATDQSVVNVWDLSSSKCTATLEGHKAGIGALTYDSENNCLVTGSNDHTIKLWDLRSKECMATLMDSDWVVLLGIDHEKDQLCWMNPNYTVIAKCCNYKNLITK